MPLQFILGQIKPFSYFMRYSAPHFTLLFPLSV